MKFDREPDAREFEHAVALVQDCKRWCVSPRKGVSCLQIDAVCMFDAGEGPCGAPLAATVVLVDDESAHAIALCKCHAGVMMLAVSRKRSDNGACLEPLGNIEAEPNVEQIVAVQRWLAERGLLGEEPPKEAPCSHDAAVDVAARGGGSREVGEALGVEGAVEGSAEEVTAKKDQAKFRVMLDRFIEGARDLHGDAPEALAREFYIIARRSGQPASVMLGACALLMRTGIDAVDLHEAGLRAKDMKGGGSA